MPPLPPRPSDRGQLRVAIVAARYAPAIGGVERHVERLAEGLAARGMAVEALVTDPTGALAPVEERNGVLVRRFPTLAGDQIYFVAPRLLRWLWQHGDEYDLFHAHGYHTPMPFLAALAARKYRRPLVVTPHYHGTGHTRLRALLHVPYRPFGGWALRRADAVLANSQAELGWLKRDFGGLPLRLNPNGIDLPGAGDTATLEAAIGALDRADDEVTLLSVGRLERYKGVAQIVAALPFLPGNHRLTVVGEGPDRKAIEATAERLGVADRVRLRGRVATEEVLAWYAACDAYVTLSREESFGLTVLEAAGAGAPVLASDIPAHREVAGYAAPGRIQLVAPGADGATVAAAIRATLLQGRTQDRSGWAIPTWPNMVAGVVSTYESIASGD